MKNKKNGRLLLSLADQLAELFSLWEPESSWAAELETLWKLVY